MAMSVKKLLTVTEKKNGIRVAKGLNASQWIVHLFQIGCCTQRQLGLLGGSMSRI